MNCSYLTDPALKRDCENRNRTGGWAAPSLNASGANQPTLPMVTSVTGSTSTATTKPSTWSSIMGGLNDIVGLSGGLMNAYGAFSNVELQRKAAEAQIKAGQKQYQPVQPQPTNQPMAGFQLASLGGIGSPQYPQANNGGADMKKIGFIVLAGVGGLIAVVLVTNAIKK